MPRRLTRRGALAGAGSVSLASLLAACAGSSDGPAAEVTTTAGDAARVSPGGAPGSAAELLGEGASCTLTAEQVEGPFYFDVDSVRRDIRAGREGMPLRLAVRVRDAQSCEPLPDAVVDVWHADAAGVYSGFGEGEGERFLRGAQVTDADGVAEFLTIYPGGYSGRTPHVHAKVHLDRGTVLTTQLYFDDAVTRSVHGAPPYATGGAAVANAQDGLFDPSLLLALRRRERDVLGAISLDVRRA